MVALTPPVACTNAFPFTGVAAQQADWQKMAAIFAPSGIVVDGAFGSSLVSYNGIVSQHGAGDLSVDIGPMRVWIQGAFAEFGLSTNLALATPPDPSFARTDLVVVRATWGTTPTIELDWVTGVAAPVPGVPALTQTLGQSWELALAQVTMGAAATLIVNANIIDRRPISSAPTPTRLPVTTSAAAITLPLNQYGSWSPVAPFWVLPLTGSTAVTSINAGAGNLPVNGALLLVEFQSTLTLTNGSNLVLRGDFQAVAGDYILLYTDGSVWREVSRSRPLSTPVAANTGLLGPISGAAAIPTMRLLLNVDMPVGPGDPTPTSPASPGIDNGRLALNVTRSPNLCINPGYEIWQRGVGAFTADAAFTADRHQIHLAGADTISVAPDPTTHDVGSGNSARVDFVLVGGAGGSRHTQYLKPGADLQTAVLGPTLSYGVRVKINGGGSTICRAGISWDGGSANTIWSAYNTNTAEWQTLFVSASAAGSPTFVEVGVWLAASCTVWIDNEVLVVGSVAPNFSGRLYQEDLYQCQRYYEIMGQDNAGDIINSGGVAVGAGENSYVTIPWKVEKAIAAVLGPSGTLASIKQGTWNKTNSTEPVADVVSRYSVRLQIASAAAGLFHAHNGAAGAKLIGIATP